MKINKFVKQLDDAGIFNKNKKCCNCKKKNQHTEYFYYQNKMYCYECLLEYFRDEEYIQDKYFQMFLDIDCERVAE